MTDPTPTYTPPPGADDPNSANAAAKNTDIFAPVKITDSQDPGFLTQHAAPAIVASSDQYRAGIDGISKDIQTQLASMGISAPTSADLSKALSDLQANMKTEKDTLETRRQQSIDDITAQFDKAQKDLENKQTRETGTESVSLARLGGYLGGSASESGVLQHLADTHQSQLTDLQSKRASALQAAKNAVDDKEFALAKQYTSDARQIGKDIDQKRVDYFNMLDKIQKNQQAEVAAQTKDTAANQKTIDDITKNYGGHSFDSLSAADQKTITDTATKAGIPLALVQDRLSKPGATVQSALNDAQVLGLMAKGVNDPATIFKILNTDSKGNLTGNITLKSINAAVKNATIKPKSPSVPSDMKGVLSTIEQHSLTSSFQQQYKLSPDDSLKLANLITKGVTGGASLESIRQALIKIKLDPKILGTYDRVVNIQNLLAGIPKKGVRQPKPSPSPSPSVTP